MYDSVKSRNQQNANSSGKNNKSTSFRMPHLTSPAAVSPLPAGGIKSLSQQGIGGGDGNRGAGNSIRAGDARGSRKSLGNPTNGNGEEKSNHQSVVPDHHQHSHPSPGLSLDNNQRGVSNGRAANGSKSADNNHHNQLESPSSILPPSSPSRAQSKKGACMVS